MIDVSRETLVRITRASEHFPSRPHLATLFRWVQKGVKGHRLEAVRVGAIWHTSIEAIARFLAALNGHAAPPPPRRAAEAAGEALRRKGA